MALVGLALSVPQNKSNKGTKKKVYAVAAKGMFHLVLPKNTKKIVYAKKYGHGERDKGILISFFFNPPSRMSN